MADTTPIVPKAEEAIKTTVINKNFNSIDDRFRTNVIKDEDGDNRIIFGKLPDGTYGLIISKPGIDVLGLF